MNPFDKAYEALKSVAAKDLPTLKHLIAVKQAYENDKSFNKDAMLSLQMLLIKLNEVDPEAAIMLGTQSWEPNITAWVQMLDALGPEGLGAYIGINSEDQIPRGPDKDAPKESNSHQTSNSMKATDIIKAVESTKTSAGLLASLCEDMTFTEGQEVFVAASVGQASMKGKYRGLANGGYAKIEDRRGVVHTVLPHYIFAIGSNL